MSNRFLPRAARTLFDCIVLWAGLTGIANAADRDPLVHEKTFLLASDRRSVAVDTVVPRQGRALGIVVFSHGANAAPDRYRAIIDPWARAGFVVVSPLHLDSEDHPQRESVDRGRVLRTRIEDMDVILTAIAEHRLFGVALARRIGRGPVIAAGHSYGAYIAQIAAGATAIDPAGGKVLTGAHPSLIGAVVALSPPPASPGFNPPESWHSLTKPMLLQTGTADVFPVFAPRWEQHLDSFHAAPGRSNWAAIYTAVDHYFGGSICRLTSPPNPLQRSALDRFATLSIAFMRATATLSDTRGQQSFEKQLTMLSDQHLSSTKAP